MSNKFADALNSKKLKEAHVHTDKENKKLSVHDRPSRRSTKHIGGYFDPVVSKQLRTIALDEDSSVQKLLAEAIDMLFQSRNKPMISQKNSE